MAASVSHQAQISSAKVRSSSLSLHLVPYEPHLTTHSLTHSTTHQDNYPLPPIYTSCVPLSRSTSTIANLDPSHKSIHDLPSRLPALCSSARGIRVLDSSAEGGIAVHTGGMVAFCRGAGRGRAGGSGGDEDFRKLLVQMTRQEGEEMLNSFASVIENYGT